MFKKRQEHSTFRDNIWDANLGDMQLISKYIKRFAFYYALCMFLVNKDELFPLKIKKSIKFTNTFLKILSESHCKRNKKWVDKSIEIRNRSMKSWWQDYDIEIYSTHNLEYVVAEILLKP